MEPLFSSTGIRIADDLSRDPRGSNRQHPVAAEKVKGIKHVYEGRPRKDKRGVDLISDALPSPVVRRYECGRERNRLR